MDIKQLNEELDKINDVKEKEYTETEKELINQLIRTANDISNLRGHIYTELDVNTGVGKEIFNHALTVEDNIVNYLDKLGVTKDEDNLSMLSEI